MTPNDDQLHQLSASLKKAVDDIEPPADLLARLRAQLANAETPAARRNRLHIRRGPTAGLRALPALFGVVITVAIAGVALTALSHHHRATPTTPPASTSSAPPYIAPTDPAMKYVTKLHWSAAACNARPPRRVSRPMISHAVPSKLLAILSVLRRPATPADKLPASYTGPMPIERVIYTNYIRRARIYKRTSYYLIPGIVTRGSGVSARCAAALQAELGRRLPEIPQHLRTHARQVLADLIAEARYDSQPHQALCVAEFGPGGGSGTCGATAAKILQRGVLGGLVGDPNIVTGVVPDGVATVVLRYRTKRGPDSVTLTTTHPVENVFIAHVPRNRSRFPSTIVWLSAQGTVIKTIQ
ncbi:MAG: hypothetical protein ACLP01_13380 [Solirubrobacteraceae bacterium]